MTQYQQKKPTKGDIERRMRNAIVLVPKDKETKSVFFDDKGLRLTVTDDFAVIATMFHSHVFNALTASGTSLPYLYTKRFVEIALENDCTTKDNTGDVTRSYAKLFSILKEKKDTTEYNISWFYDLWLSNIFAPLYSIGSSESEAFLVYESYLHNVARNQVILSEKVNDITNKGFIKQVSELVDKFTDGMDEKIIFPKKTDDETMKEEIEALAEQQQKKVMEEYANGNNE